MPSLTSCGCHGMASASRVPKFLLGVREYIIQEICSLTSLLTTSYVFVSQNNADHDLSWFTQLPQHEGLMQMKPDRRCPSP